jgi:hypothetical protein
MTGRLPMNANDTSVATTMKVSNATRATPMNPWLLVIVASEIGALALIAGVLVGLSATRFRKKLGRSSEQGQAQRDGARSDRRARGGGANADYLIRAPRCRALAAVERTLPPERP